MEKQQTYLDIEQVAKWWTIQKVTVGSRVDSDLLPVVRLPHNDRHFPQRASSPKKPLRKYHHNEEQRSKSSIRTNVAKGGLPSDYESIGDSSISAREKPNLYPETSEDKAEKHIGSRPSKKFRITQWKLENVLLWTDFVIFFVMVTKLVATRRSRDKKNVNTNGKNLNGKTLVGKITNGMIFLGNIENGDQRVRVSFFKGFRLQRITIPQWATDAYFSQS